MILQFLIWNLGRAVLDGTRPTAYVSWRAWVSKRFTFSVTRQGLGETTMRYLRTGGRLGTLCLVQRNQYESAKSCSCVHHSIKWIIFHNCRYPFLHRAPSWWNDAVPVYSTGSTDNTGTVLIARYQAAETQCSPYSKSTIRFFSM